MKSGCKRGPGSPSTRGCLGNEGSEAGVTWGAVWGHGGCWGSWRLEFGGGLLEGQGPGCGWRGIASGSILLWPGTPRPSWGDRPCPPPRQRRPDAAPSLGGSVPSGTRPEPGSGPWLARSSHCPHSHVGHTAGEASIVTSTGPPASPVRTLGLRGGDSARGKQRYVSRTTQLSRGGNTVPREAGQQGGPWGPVACRALFPPLTSLTPGC